MSKVTFHGLPAWVGAIHSPTVCDWWSDDPAQMRWDRTLMNTIDLAMTPAAATAGRIKPAQIEADDFTGHGGRTTIGPLFPGGTSIGACWVSDHYLTKLGGKLRPGVRPGVSGHDYEWTFVQYFDGEQHNRRFYGFHANLVDTQNHLSLVQLWNPGTGAGSAKPAGAWWLDLAADTDPSAPPLTKNKPAPVMLDKDKIAHLNILEPKAPPFKGSFAFAP